MSPVDIRLRLMCAWIDKMAENMDLEVDPSVEFLYRTMCKLETNNMYIYFDLYKVGL